MTNVLLSSKRNYFRLGASVAFATALSVLPGTIPSAAAATLAPTACTASTTGCCLITASYTSATAVAVTVSTSPTAPSSTVTSGTPSGQSSQYYSGSPQACFIPAWYAPAAGWGTSGTTANYASTAALTTAVANDMQAQELNSATLNAALLAASNYGTATLPGLVILQPYNNGSTTVGTTTLPAQVGLGATAPTIGTGGTNTGAVSFTAYNYGVNPLKNTVMVLASDFEIQGPAPIDVGFYGTSAGGNTYFTSAGAIATSGTQLTNNSFMIKSSSGNNTTITGTGVIDGNGPLFWATMLAFPTSTSATGGGQPGKVVDLSGNGFQIGANFNNLGQSVTPSYSAISPTFVTSHANPTGTLLTIRNSPKAALDFEKGSYGAVVDGVWIYNTRAKGVIPSGLYQAGNTPTLNLLGDPNGTSGNPSPWAVPIVNSTSPAVTQISTASYTSAGQSMVNIAPNTDAIDVVGMNVDGVHTTLIQNCILDTGDDDIAVKSNTLGYPSNNTTVRNCIFGGGHGMSVGGQETAGIYNLSVSNIWFNGTDYGLKVKTNNFNGCSSDGITCGTSFNDGVTSNVSYNNVCMYNVAIPIQLTLRYNGSVTSASGTGVNAYSYTRSSTNGYTYTTTTPEQIGPAPVISNVTFNNVISNNVGYPTYLGGASVALADISGSSAQPLVPSTFAAATTSYVVNTPGDVTPSANGWVSWPGSVLDLIQNIRITNSSFAGPNGTTYSQATGSFPFTSPSTTIAPFTVEEATVAVGVHSKFGGATYSPTNPAIFAPAGTNGTIIPVVDVGPTFPCTAAVTIPTQQPNGP
jgi:polygalacturonase